MGTTPETAEAKLAYVRLADGTLYKIGGGGSGGGGGGAPSGAAGGDLSGTYPDPQIAAGVIVNADVNASAAIAQSKIANLTTDLAGKLDQATADTLYADIDSAGGGGYVGDWDSGTTYPAGSVVSHLGASWGTESGAPAGDEPEYPAFPGNTGVGSDAIADATRIYVETDGSTVPGTAFSNATYTSEASEPTGSMNQSAWWIYTPLSTGMVTFTTNDAGASGDSKLSLYSRTGSGPPTFAQLTHIATDDDAGGSNRSLITYNVIGGTTYCIQHGTYAGTISYALKLTGARATAPPGSPSWALVGIESGGISQTTADARYLQLTGGTLTGALGTFASATGGAGLRVPHGTAPTSPANGDVWTTTSGLYARINGVTVGPLDVSGLTQTAADLRYLQLTGGSLTGNLDLQSAGGTTRGVTFSTIPGTGNGNRWRVAKAGTTESSTSTGSNLVVSRYANDASYIDNPVEINRTDGVVNFLKPIYLTDPVPVSSNHAVSKSHLDGETQNLDWKSSVQAASTGNLTLSGTQTVDGVALSATARILVKDQTTATENGIYTVAAGAWTRATDADTSNKVQQLVVAIREGTTQAETIWMLSSNPPITLGTTPLTFVPVLTNGTADLRYLQLTGGTVSGNVTIQNGVYGNSPLNGSDYVCVQAGNAHLLLGVSADKNAYIIGRHASSQVYLRPGNTSAGQLVVDPTYTLVSSPQLILDQAAGTTSALAFMVGASLRWTFTRSAGTEPGSNVGSDFYFGRYSDAGAWIDNPLTINRANGTVVLGQGLLLAASTTTRASVRISHGTAPTSPVNGDMWTTSADGLQVRVNGVTYPQAGVVVGGTKPTSPPVGTVWVPSGSTVQARSYAVNVASGTTVVVTHSLATTDVVVAVYRLSDGMEVDVPFARTSTNAITLNSAVDLTGHRVVVLAAGG